jgi:hypothetical protein
VLVVGVLSAAAAAAMAAVVPLARPVLAALLLVLQCGFVVAWSFALDTPEPVGAIAVAAGAAAASDGLLLRNEHVSLTDFATIVAVAFLLALVWQLARRQRFRVTESLASAVAATVVAVAGGAYLTLRAGIGGHVGTTAGRQATAVTLLGVATVLGVGRLVDAWFPVPALTGSRRRGLTGLVLGLTVAAGIGALYGSQVAGSVHGAQLVAAAQRLTAGKGALVALAAAAVAGLSEVGIEAGFATLGADQPAGGSGGGRRAPWPARLVVVAVLPVLIAAPAGYVVARVVLT